MQFFSWKCWYQHKNRLPTHCTFKWNEQILFQKLFKITVSFHDNFEKPYEFLNILLITNIFPVLRICDLHNLSYSTYPKEENYEKNYSTVKIKINPPSSSPANAENEYHPFFWLRLLSSELAEWVWRKNCSAYPPDWQCTYLLALILEVSVFWNKYGHKLGYYPFVCSRLQTSKAAG